MLDRQMIFPFLLTRLKLQINSSGCHGSWIKDHGSRRSVAPRCTTPFPDLSRTAAAQRDSDVEVHQGWIGHTQHWTAICRSVEPSHLLQRRLRTECSRPIPQYSRRQLLPLLLAQLGISSLPQILLQTRKSICGQRGAALLSPSPKYGSAYTASHSIRTHKDSRHPLNHHFLL